MISYQDACKKQNLPTKIGRPRSIVIFIALHLQLALPGSGPILPKLWPQSLEGRGLQMGVWMGSLQSPQLWLSLWSENLFPELCFSLLPSWLHPFLVPPSNGPSPPPFLFFPKASFSVAVWQTREEAFFSPLVDEGGCYLGLLWSDGGQR